MAVKIYGEVGSCWYDPDPDVALQNALDAIHMVKACGANGVKFQLFSAYLLYSIDRAPEIYKSIGLYELPVEWLSKLKDLAYALRLDFGLSVFSKDLADIAIEHVDFIKIASGDLTNVDLVHHVCKLVENNRGVGLQISTGAADAMEVSWALDIVGLYNLWECTTMFHCVSAYPSKPTDMNLASGFSAVRGTGAQLGLSDHTKGSLVSQIAVGAGYEVFEKHVNLSGTTSAPDDIVALNKKQFSSYVDNVRLAEKIMGDSIKEPQESEVEERIWARRGKDGLRPAND